MAGSALQAGGREFKSLTAHTKKASYAPYEAFFVSIELILIVRIVTCQSHFGPCFPRFVGNMWDGFCVLGSPSAGFDRVMWDETQERGRRAVMVLGPCRLSRSERRPRLPVGCWLELCRTSVFFQFACRRTAISREAAAYPGLTEAEGTLATKAVKAGSQVDSTPTKGLGYERLP
jgi:hypothetical protein